MRCLVSKMCNQCSICYDDVSSTSNIATTKCGHRFHTSCLIMWITSNTNKNCPVCRMKLIDEEEEEHIHTEIDIDSLMSNLNNEWSIGAYEEINEINGGSFTLLNADESDDESDEESDEEDDDEIAKYEEYVSTNIKEAEKAYTEIIDKAKWLSKNKLKHIVHTMTDVIQNM